MHYLDEKITTSLLNYPQLTQKLLAAHRYKTEIIEDTMIESDSLSDTNRYFIRSAWQENHYLGSKLITIFPRNNRAHSMPTIQAIYTLFDAKNGKPLCIIDGNSLTYLKTAADSALGTDLLARKDVKTMLMVGAGSMAEHLIQAHCALRPSINNVLIWNRTVDRCKPVIESLVKLGINVTHTPNLNEAVNKADLISCATATTDPIIEGKHLSPGTHLDLIGSFTEKMREVDDSALKRGSLFVDSRQMSLDVVGELVIPLKNGVIKKSDIKADLYDLCKQSGSARKSEEEITIFKNAGGGHLDLMVATILYKAFLDAS